jgi:hypothetical protein
MTVVDRLNVSRDERNTPVWSSLTAVQKPVRICWELDIPRWKNALFAALK